MARGTLVPSRSEGKRDASEEQPENDEDEESDRARLASGSKRERTESLAVPYKVGQHIDVLDSVDRWAEAKILKIDLDNKRVYVTFLYWSYHFDTWVDDIGRRCAYLHTHTYTPGGVMRLGQRLDVLDEINKWLEAFVIDESPTEVLIHFKGYSKRFDVWLPRDSPRIRQFGSGENKRNRTIIPQKTWAVPGNPQRAVDRTRKIEASSDRYALYAQALRVRGLHVQAMAGDGNCLFRSVAHQLYNDDSLHGLVRERCMDYMEVNAAFFSMFVEGGIECFDRYIAMKRQLSCWGDDPEIQALCEIYGRRAEIWCFDSGRGAKMLRTYHEGGSRGDREGAGSPAICLSFYGGGHYDSIVGPSFDRCLLRTQPGVVEEAAVARARRLVSSGRGGRGHLTAGGAWGADPSATVAAEAASDLYATENATLELALSSSRRDMEAYGEEDIETCLALSLSSIGAGHDTGSAGAYQDGNGERKGETSLFDLDRDDKAVLDLVMKESADQHKGAPSAPAAGGAVAEAKSEEDIIEEQILEQARQESLRLAEGRGGYPEEKLERVLVTPRAEDDLTAALRQSEEEMLQQAMRLSQASAPSVGGYGARSVPSNRIVVDGSAATAGQDDEDEMLRLAILQSVQACSGESISSINNSNANANANSTSSNANVGAVGSVAVGGAAGFDDEDDDLRRAIAASMQDR